MKPTLLLIALCLFVWALAGPRHQYIIERVKDVNGNDAFLRIDASKGEECAIGHGFAVVREKLGLPPTEGYVVPFCDEGKK
jgi:hypothetical protein